MSVRDIKIIPLAKKKIAQRKIEEKWVIDTITSPDQKIDGYGGRFVAQKRLKMEGKEKLLRVVYEEATSCLLVITAYLTSQIERYWRKEL